MFDYSDSPYPIRADLQAAHRFAWDAFAAPGTWWTGVERVTIAAAVRDAREGASEISPRHAELPAPALEAAQRIGGDLHSLNQGWFEGLKSQRLSDGQYIEIVSIAVILSNVDTFRYALGLPQEPLPAPQPGPSSQYVPAGVKSHESWAPIIPVLDLDGPEGDLYFGGKRMANVITAMSLVPDAVRLLNVVQTASYVGHTAQGLDMGDGGRAIGREQIEFIAGRVSAINQCFY